ncbi:Sn1-specific diacylglycerol lipase alpha [Orchesella cincta]|uniref:Sn1-specific diacylglycerol lipase alpha n=1 Tax=Orchesella cincta TaxID=48709 RepID=A0A1D2N1F9_ORCCI|nr:Sn1-specific diacylglycerol lipase alpha [Orchesella cincta]
MLVICTCFVILSLVITAWCTYDVAGRSWVKMKRYQANMKEMDRKQAKRSGSRHRNWRQRLTSCE